MNIIHKILFECLVLFIYLIFGNQEVEKGMCACYTHTHVIRHSTLKHITQL